MPKKLVALVFLVVPILGVAACGGSDHGNGKPSAQHKSAQEHKSSGHHKSTPRHKSSEKQKSPPQQDGAKPNLTGIPDVVADVNGHKIKKDEFVNAYKGQFQQMAMQAQQTGQRPNQKKLKKQVAQELVSTELLTQEAGRRHIKATQQRVDKSFNDLEKQNGITSKAKLFAAFKKQGVSKAKVIDEIKNEVKVKKLISKDAGSTKPTSKELHALYKQMVAQQKQSAQGGKGQKVPSFQQAKPQLEQQIASQKESAAAQQLITKLRKKGNVKVYL